MGHFVPALNGSCSCPPMGRDLGPNPARYNGSCRPGTKLFRVVPCLCRAFFSCFGPAHQARPKCTPITKSTLSGAGVWGPRITTRACASAWWAHRVSCFPSPAQPLGHGAHMSSTPSHSRTEIVHARPTKSAARPSITRLRFS
jgi:hypothetical protein